ncbi:MULTISPECIES: hypothetical protein [unclassified Rhodanobacter]|uniref:hypothetical protein n=1 Tax=unclassified Rhodanobacter TaxID=2621553 RepID=UPI000AF68484|nr:MULTISPECIES: hypothetical protein [unclassified Rhodanobacter]
MTSIKRLRQSASIPCGGPPCGRPPDTAERRVEGLCRHFMATPSLLPERPDPVHVPAVPACADLSQEDRHDRVSLLHRCEPSRPAFRLIP